jgi:hypothetical protein
VRVARPFTASQRCSSGATNLLTRVETENYSPKPLARKGRIGALNWRCCGGRNLRLSSRSSGHGGTLFQAARAIADVAHHIGAAVYCRGSTLCRFKREIGIQGHVVYDSSCLGNRRARGVPIQFVAMIMGHKGTRMLMEVYNHLESCSDELRDALNLANGRASQMP